MAYTTKVLSICALCLCLGLAAAELNVTLTADKTDVPIGDKFGLTCAFSASKDDFEEAQFSNNGEVFFTFKPDTKGAQEGVDSYTASLEAAGTNSSVSVAVKASLCGDDKAEDRNFECTVKAAGDSDSDSAALKVTGDAASESCDDKPSGGKNATDVDGADVTTVEPSGSNNGTTTGTGDNLGLYGSAIAFITILIVIVLLGLIGLWHLASTRKRTADAKV